VPVACGKHALQVRGKGGREGEMGGVVVCAVPQVGEGGGGGVRVALSPCLCPSETTAETSRDPKGKGGM
jgi:hypothetical protein